MIARIAVVLPAYNEASLIGPALQALRAQTLAPAELIVVDNGSTDATALIARRLASRVIHEPA
ncbi:MAG TPA: glycosyltransferase, partial [Kouleothrix sp.]|nr:glycosyltransferase [Kouleothrix sp.]